MIKFEITKYFKGGGHTHYAILSINKRVRKSCWQDQQEEWGDATPGGHNYEYQIRVKQVDIIPRGANRLKFNKKYLITKKRKRKPLELRQFEAI